MIYSLFAVVVIAMTTFLLTFLNWKFNLNIQQENLIALIIFIAAMILTQTNVVFNGSEKE